MAEPTKQHDPGSAPNQTRASFCVAADVIRGTLPINVALAQAMMAAADEAEAWAAIAVAALSDTPSARRAADMLALLDASPRAFPAVAAAMAAEAEARAQGGDVAAWANLFDRLAERDPDPAVALYGLGRDDLLAAATAEVVEALAADGLLTRQSTVLDFGCGAGRIAAALAPRVGRVVGVEVSARMAERARAATAAMHNVLVVRGHGRDLGYLRPGSVDLVLAVDSFPYLVAAGEAVAAAHLAGMAAALRGGGRLRVLNFAYRLDLRQQEAALRRLGGESGLRLVDVRPSGFRYWDAMVLDLVRTDTVSPPRT